MIDVSVGITQYTQTERAQIVVSYRIGAFPFGFVMLRTVQFNYEPGRKTIEINDVGTDRFLPINCNRQSF